MLKFDQSYDSYDRAANRGPVSFGIKVILTVAILVAVIWGISTVFSVGKDAADTTRKEFQASALLKKYTWFKDASAQLDAKAESVRIMDAGVRELKRTPRAQMDRADKESLNQKETELEGLKISYNNLAGEYNSAMAKANWSFANVGMLPQGATNPLPREYKPYISQ